MQPTQRRISGLDGLEINVLEWSTEGTPLVFVHGFANDAHVWDDVAPAVATHYRVLCPDMRGHGDSGRDSQAAYDPDSMTGDLECVLDALGVERLVLVGHSMGGGVSIRYAGRHPEKMAGLVIVDTAPETDRRGALRIGLDMQQSSHSYDSIADYERLLARQYPVTPAGTLSRLARVWLRQREDGRFELKLDPNLMKRHASGSVSQADERARDEAKKLQWLALEQLSCPALVIRGAASDILDPETADKMVDEVIPNAKLAVIPRAGHSVMLDNPEEFKRALCDFVLG